MSFQIFFHPETLRDLSQVLENIKKRIDEAIQNRLTTAPPLYGKPLRGELLNLWSLRVDDYRVIYKMKKDAVIVLRIVHRSNAYHAGILETRDRAIL